LKREMKMVKRTLIAMAVVGMLVASSQAAIGPDVHQNGAKIKVNDSYDAIWPFEYVALDLCVIPITMEIGYYVEVKDCHKRKIKLVQVDCGDMTKGSDWPCYQDCEDVTIRSNFEVKLGLSLRNKSAVIDKWAAYIKGDVSVVGPGENTITVCVEAWQAKLWQANVDAGTTVKVGDLVITVKPNV